MDKPAPLKCPVADCDQPIDTACTMTGCPGRHAAKLPASLCVPRKTKRRAA
jgi:hypothetical protein